MTLATISKTFDEVCASHRLLGLPEDHPCSRGHGHNYSVKLTITGHTDRVGFIIDYRDLEFFKTALKTLDHQDLNNVLGDGFNPTAENLAHHLLDLTMTTLKLDHRPAFDRLTEVSVSVSETPKTWATATTTRTAQLLTTQEDQERADRHWDTHAITPHILDEDRYRWGEPKW